MNQLAKQRMQKVEMYTQVSTGIARNAWQTTVLYASSLKWQSFGMLISG